MGEYMDEEQMEGVRLNSKIQSFCIMVFEDNEVGVDYEKAIIHANRWYVYMN